MATNVPPQPTPDGNPQLSDIVGDQLYPLLVAAIAKDVHERVDARESRSRSQFISLASIALGIVLAVGGFVANEWLGWRTDQAVAKAVERSLGPALFQVEAAKLQLDFFKRSSDGPSEGAANGFVRQLEDLYRRGVVQQQSNESAAASGSGVQAGIDALAPAVNALVLHFANTDQPTQVLAVERAAPKVVQANPDNAAFLVVALGDHLLEDAGAPGTWDTTLQGEFEKFGQYLGQAKRSAYPEFGLLYELLTGFVRGAPEQHLRGLLDDVDALALRDAMSLIRRANNIFERSNDFPATPATPATKRAAAWVRQLLDAHASDSEVLSQIDTHKWR
ncbi:MAG: hypothetical protein SV583_09850 [Pseudomonadota bacterium]|nr:hypothetical protein [Pseudomonadota bacterium]